MLGSPTLKYTYIKYTLNEKYNEMILLVHYSSQTLNKFVYRVAKKDETSETIVRNLYCQLINIYL